LNNEEYKFLEEAFQDQTDANRVIYKELVEEVEKVFTFKVRIYKKFINLFTFKIINQ
jgi:hypothetical protein